MHCPLCESAVNRPWARASDDRSYLKCGICDLVWLDKSQLPNRAKETARYLEHNNFVDDIRYLNYLDRLAKPLTSSLPQGAQGLDFGCGPAEGMKALLEPRGFQIRSYDPIFFPREALLKNRYDFVLASEVVEHFFDAKASFDLLGTLVVTGGLLGVSSRLLVSQERFLKWNYQHDPTHVVFYAESTVHWIAKKYEWELVRLEDPIWIFRIP